MRCREAFALTYYDARVDLKPSTGFVMAHLPPAGGRTVGCPLGGNKLDKLYSKTVAIQYWFVILKGALCDMAVSQKEEEGTGSPE